MSGIAEGRKALAAGLIALLAALVGTACKKAPEDTAAPAQAERTPVRVETLKLSEHADSYEAMGTVRALHTAAVSSKILSHVRSVLAEEGARVREGQLLVELDDEDLASRVRQAETTKAEALTAIEEAAHAIHSAKAQQELAEVTHERYSGLLQKKSVSQQEYDEVWARLRSARAAVEMAEARRRQAESRLAQAEAQIATARIALSYAKIHAPFSGVVTERMLDPGSLAAPGMPILTIDQEGRHRLEASVPESRLAAVRVGQQTPVVVDALQETLPGKVNEVVPAVDASSRTAIVKIALPAHPALRGGMFGRALLPGDKTNVLTVAAEAVIERGQIQSVFVVVDQTARRRLVSLGQRIEDRYAVLSGLQAGEQIVLNPGSLADGVPVEIQEERTTSANEHFGDLVTGQAAVEDRS